MTSPMSPPSKGSLLIRRRMLSRQLLAQRQLIVQQLGSVPEPHSGYPRSKTLRFLTRQPILAAGVLAALATLLMGMRFFRAVPAAIAVTRLLSSVAGREEPPSDNATTRPPL
jgi:hypothetical protein